VNGAEAISYLDVEPFRKILADRLAEIEDNTEITDPKAQIAKEAGLSERLVRRILKGEQDTLSFDNADRIVTRVVGPMAWHEDEELSGIYESLDLTHLDWAFPVSETVAAELREIAVRFVKELGNSALAAEALGISVGTVGRYARQARAVA
jgi:hypothetical protein